MKKIVLLIIGLQLYLFGIAQIGTGIKDSYSFTHSGMLRNYNVYKPALYTGTTKVPLVIVLHPGISQLGDTMNVQMERYTHFDLIGKENMDRLKSTLPSLKKFLEKGNYLGIVPKGYTLYGSRTTNFNNRAQQQKIVINEDGKLLKKAWKWKTYGERDFQIIQKLENLGLKIPKQTLSKIWRNPTYCGISTNKLLDKPTEGNWPKIVSTENFIKVQEIMDSNKNGYKVNKTNTHRPLTKHILCIECERPMTGYEVKKKGVHYYKVKNAQVIL